MTESASKTKTSSGNGDTGTDTRAVDLGDVGDTLIGDVNERAARFQHGEALEADAESGELAASLTANIRETIRAASNWSELRGTPYGIAPVILLGMVGFATNVNDQVFNLAAVPIIQDIDGVSIGSVIRYLVLSSTVLAVVSLLFAFYLDRHKRVPAYGLGLLAGGVLGAFTAGARSTLSLGSPQVAQNSGYAVGEPAVSSLLPDYYPVWLRGKAFAIIGLIAAVGAAISPVVAGATIDLFGWRAAFVILAVPMVIAGAVALRVLKEPIRGYMERKALGMPEEIAEVEVEAPSFGEAWRTVWNIRTRRRLFVANLFGSGGNSIYGFYAIIVFLPIEYDLSPFRIGLLLSASLILALPGYFIGGGLTDFLLKRRPSQVLILNGIFAIIAAIGTLVLPLKPPLWVFVIAQAVFLFGFALIGPARGALYAQITPAHVRTVSGAISGLSIIPARIIWFPIGGIVFAEYGVRSAFYLATVLLLIDGVITLSSAPFFEFDQKAAFAGALANEEYRKAKLEGDDKLLVIRDLNVSYGSVQVLFDVDIDVRENEILALLGTNGAGKSTILRAITGATDPDSGAILLAGRDITRMPPHETAQRGVIFMPGGRGIFPGLSVKENILLGAWMLEEEDDIEARLGEVYEIFPMLAERIDETAGKLSGGQQQQLSLAQAFLAKPKVLMIDELSLGLSPAVVTELIEVVKRIHATGVTIIVVEQSVNVALTLAQRAVFMEKGEVKFFGPTAELLSRPDILRAVYVKGTGALTEGQARGMTRPAHQRGLADSDAPRPVLEVEQVTKRYGGLTALDGVDLELREGEVLGLIGPNGSGKTTLFDCITGYQPVDSGRVLYDGVDVTAASPEERARRKVVRRFQDARLFPALTVYENLLLALDHRLDVKSALLGGFGAPQARNAEKRLRVRADRLLDVLELGGYRDKFVRELSTGLRRITDLACVLATEPRVLLLDEPSSGIAQSEAEGLGPLLARVRFETGCSILIIEHDMPLISQVSDELVALDQGKVMLRGTPEEVLNDDRVIEAYLGGSEAAIQRSGSLT